jgi:phosphate transport system substrate-binding protein
MGRAGLGIVLAAFLLLGGAIAIHAEMPLAQAGSEAQTPVPHRGEITGAGSALAYPMLANWAGAYEKISGYGLNYKPIGSGGGIKKIAERSVTFGAPDRPLSARERQAAGDVLQWPMILSGLVPVVNIDGVKAGDLTLDGPTLAKIFLGQIKMWDDPAIKQLKPNVKLPSTAITIIHRADGSITTFIFTDYLAKVNPEGKAKIGAGMSVQWPAGIGSKGSPGVPNEVLNTANSISYVFAVDIGGYPGLASVKMVNEDGFAVEANAATIQAAAANADWEHSDGFDIVLTAQKGRNSWPISMASFVLMPKRVPDEAAAREALKYFAWAYDNGDKIALSIGYVPLHATVKKLARARWGEAVGPGGAPAYREP